MQAVQDTIQAIRERETDVLTQIGDMRALAAALKVPYLVISMAVDASVSPEHRFCSDADIDEYRKWQLRDAR